MSDDHAMYDNMWRKQEQEQEFLLHELETSIFKHDTMNFLSNAIMFDLRIEYSYPTCLSKAMNTYSNFVFTKAFEIPPWALN